MVFQAAILCLNFSHLKIPLYLFCRFSSPRLECWCNCSSTLFSLVRKRRGCERHLQSSSAWWFSGNDLDPSWWVSALGCWHFFARWKMVSSIQPQKKPWRKYFKWSENCSLSKRIRQWGNIGSLLTMNVTIPWLLKVFCKAALTRSKMDSRFGLIKSCASIFLISKKTTGSLVRRSRWSVGARKRKWYKI